MKKPDFKSRAYTATERIRLWVEWQFGAKYVDRVTEDLINVATGNREGNRFEREALERIFPEWK
jgi:hypothetical protein